MNTIDLDKLQRFMEQARELQAIAADLKPFLELIRELDEKKILAMPTDRLIHAGEAAKLLGVNQNSISSFVKKGLLTPLYVNPTSSYMIAQRQRGLRCFATVIND